MEIARVIGLCYDYGWRDKNLITMVSIVGAETQYNANYQDEANCRYGLFGVPANGDWQVMLDPEYATKVARQIFEESYFNFWPSFATAACLSYIDDVVDSAGQFYSSLIRKELIGQK